LTGVEIDEARRVLPPRLYPSSIGRYRTCPRQFLFADIERAPRSGETSPALVVGLAVHAALDSFYGLSLEQRRPENLERALRAAWPNVRKPNSFASRDEEISCGHSALQMLHRYSETFDLRVVPLGRERWVKFRLDGQEISGKIDRIDEGRYGGIDLIDYKTGRFMLDEDDLPREAAVQVYALGAEATLRRQVERIRFIYLAQGAEISWEPEREDVEVLAERLKTTLDELRRDQLFEPRPGQHCGFCPFLCDARGRGELEQLVVDPEEVPF
jgi:putative RecB family exonuclease